MREAPELDKKIEGEKVEKSLYQEETPPGHYAGGATSQKALEMEEVAARKKIDQEAITKTKETVEENFPAKKSETEEEKKPLDISFLKAKIEELEEKANKENVFKKWMGGTKETARRLKMGLLKIENPKTKAVFGKYFEEAYNQGGEKLALEYAESVGNGELVIPKDGVLMAKSSNETFFPS